MSSYGTLGLLAVLAPVALSLAGCKSDPLSDLDGNPAGSSGFLVLRSTTNANDGIRGRRDDGAGLVPTSAYRDREMQCTSHVETDGHQPRRDFAATAIDLPRHARASTCRELQVRETVTTPADSRRGRTEGRSYSPPG